MPLQGGVYVMGDFLPSALRWAVTRRPCGAISGINLSKSPPRQSAIELPIATPP
ncbi:MAG: hypothetical protein LBP75_00110 [Planctomycetota bacterium]|nr:hypothetical protein [Planctomycetota bacterium]